MSLIALQMKYFKRISYTQSLSWFLFYMTTVYGYNRIVLT